MPLFRDNQALGLDIGQSCVKGVVLRHDGKKVELVEERKLDCRGEGLIGDEEIASELTRWFHEAGWEKTETTVAVPQYLASTQISDFPPSSRGNLSDMVRFETQHLAGLSGEEFIYDYASMPPRFGRSSPVLIGMCRQSVIYERTRTLQDLSAFETLDELIDWARSRPAAGIEKIRPAISRDAGRILTPGDAGYEEADRLWHTV